MYILAPTEKICILQERMHLNLQCFLSAEVYGPKNAARHLTQFFIFCWAPQLPSGATSPVLAARGPDVCQMISPSLHRSMYFLLCMFFQHIARQGADPPCSLGIFTLNTGGWFQEQLIYFTRTDSDEPKAGRFCVGYFSLCLCKQPQYSRKRIPKAKSSWRLLSWRQFLWSSHNANIVTHST